MLIIGVAYIRGCLYSGPTPAYIREPFVHTFGKYMSCSTSGEESKRCFSSSKWSLYWAHAGISYHRSRFMWVQLHIAAPFWSCRLAAGIHNNIDFSCWKHLLFWYFCSSQDNDFIYGLALFPSVIRTEGIIYCILVRGPDYKQVFFRGPDYKQLLIFGSKTKEQGISLLIFGVAYIRGCLYTGLYSMLSREELQHVLTLYQKTSQGISEGMERRRKDDFSRVPRSGWKESRVRYDPGESFGCAAFDYDSQK